MNTLKKLASTIFVLALSLSLFALPSVALAAETSAPQVGTYVFDEQGLFSESEFQSLESTAADLAGKYNMGVYFLTTDYMNGLSDPSSEQRTNYATTYYREHKLGLNPGENGYGDGIMFVVAAKSRDYVTIAYGQGSYSFSDKGIDAMEEDVKEELSDKHWYEAAKVYYKDIGSQLEYYAKHGKPQNPLGLFDWIIRIAIVLGVPLIITFTVINNWRRQMLTAVEKSEAGEYLDPSSVNVTRANDRFIHTSVIATPKPKDNSNSSGGWGGGGGGGFSSSGGGKF